MVCENSRCTDERAKEGTNGEKSDDETFTDSGEFACAGVARCLTCSKADEEVWHEKDIGDLTSIILCMAMSLNRRREGERTYTKNEATHGGQDGQHDRYPPNGQTISVMP